MNYQEKCYGYILLTETFSTIQLLFLSALHMMKQEDIIRTLMEWKIGTYGRDWSQRIMLLFSILLQPIIAYQTNIDEKWLFAHDWLKVEVYH